MPYKPENWHPNQMNYSFRHTVFKISVRDSLIQVY